ncbi:hypothetical protein AO498_06240 [Algoriphagus sanaruensis]|uniref:Uncharacterized protein n=1 Tax=Algoriphagus sanaruensis TaxID=1727163 RepID=A0A142ELK0_9BACT|nr:hypothetical protein AO498_06240 [Algoriphagus sanaruensis]
MELADKNWLNDSLLSFQYPIQFINEVQVQLLKTVNLGRLSADLIHLLLHAGIIANYHNCLPKKY